MTRTSKIKFLSASLILAAAQLAHAQTPKLSVHWEELTGPDFVTAIHQSQSTCILPIGIMEKHGPTCPSVRT